MCSGKLFLKMILGRRKRKLRKAEQGGRESQYQAALVSWFLLWEIGVQSRPARSHVWLSSESKGVLIHCFPSLIVKRVPWLVTSLTVASLHMYQNGWLGSYWNYSWLWQKQPWDRKWEGYSIFGEVSGCVTCIQLLQQCCCGRWRDCR